MTNQPPPGRGFQVDDLGHEDAGRPDNPAAGLEHERRARSRGRRAGSRRRRLGGRRARPAAAGTRCRGRRRGRGARAGRLAPTARARESATVSAARASGSALVICDPMCTCSPTRRRSVRAATSRIIARASSSDTPNLVAREPGRDVRMTAGVDVGIDAHGDARARALRPRRWPRCARPRPDDSALIARRRRG